MKALIAIEHGASMVDEARVADLAAFAAEQLCIPEPAEASITFVDDEQMAKLNEGYRGKAGPTDVLSFECDNLEDGFPAADEVFEAGDIIMAPDVAARQAHELGHSFEEEVDTLLVHGILHLMGYDHIEDADAAQMQALQDKVLACWWARQGGGSGV